MTAIAKVIISMLIEGMSIPFPGIIFLLTWGSVNEPDIEKIALLSIFLASSYTIGSFLPYFLGAKIGSRMLSFFGEKVNAAVLKGGLLMNKYGLIIISISRPFGWGNYVSYIAGVSKVNKLKYLILTFIGIYPWCFIMLYLGKRFRGNISFVTEYIDKYTFYIYGVVIAVTVIFMLTKYNKYRKSRKIEE